MTTGMLVESPVRGNSHAGFGGRPAETERPKAATAPRADPTSASDALDEIRRAVWNQARKDNNKQLAKELKGARFVL